MKTCDGALISSIEEKYKTLERREEVRIMYLNIKFDEMFNISNVVITSLHDLIKKIFKDSITKVPNKRFSSLTQKMNAVCEELSESKALPHKPPVCVLVGINWCSVPEFIGSFELMPKNEHFRHMEYDDVTVNDKRNLERVKNIPPMEDYSLYSMNVSNTRNIPSIHKNLL